LLLLTIFHATNLKLEFVGVHHTAPQIEKVLAGVVLVEIFGGHLVI
jgi:hypothetical protein